MKQLMIISLLCLTSLFSAVGMAGPVETYEFSDEVTRERFQSLSEELRCPKCQNQNLADSNSPIARDLRRQVYEQLTAGQSDQQIVDFMVDRYGEYVLYKPKFDPVTYVLWIGPAGFGALGLLILAIVVFMQRRKKPTENEEVMDAPLTAEQQKKLDEILGKDD